MSDNSASTPQHGFLLIAGVVVIAVVVASLWWTKTIAFSNTATVAVTTVDTTPTPKGPDQTYSANSVSLDVDDTTLRSIAKKAAAVTGDDVGTVEKSLELSAEGNRIHVTAKGRTPSTAAELANAAASALANQYDDIGSSFSGMTVSAVVEPAA